MNSPSDTYRTIVSETTNILFKAKHSKFYGFAFHVSNETEVKNCISRVKKEHYSARHWCYAYQIGLETKTHRVNDDGEPGNTAGMPIYGQLLSFDLTNALVIVVRYFGGVKLGVGGLIQAYKTTAELTLKESDIQEKTITTNFKILFGYEHMNKVMRIVKEHRLNITTQNLELKCEIHIAVRNKNAQQIFDIFNALYRVEILKL